MGPYSQAVKVGPWLFCSGQIPLDPKSSKIVGQDIKAQTDQVFKNICAVLKEADMSFNHVVKTTVFLTNMQDFPKFNTQYELYFVDHRPARSCIEVSALPKKALVELELIAYKAT